MNVDDHILEDADEDRTDFVSAEDPDGSLQTREPVLLVVSGARAGLTVNVTDAPIVIGRAQHCGVWMEGSGISREHARVARDSTGAVTVTDLQSTNGTFVNGERITARRLSAGDQIRIGPETMLKFEHQTATEQTFHEQRLEQGARDNLTGLYDRRHFLSKMRADMVRVLRARGSASVIKISVDGFNRMTTRFGHDAGEVVLRRLAKLLAMGLRERDLLARWGEKKFAILVHGGELETATLTAERLRKAVENYRIEWNRERVPVTISVGVAAMHKDDLADMQELLAEVDENLTRARAGGGNRVVMP